MTFSPWRRVIVDSWIRCPGTAIAPRKFTGPILLEARSVRQMGSYQQIIVSGMLLIGAFLFGRYVTNQQNGLTRPTDVPVAFSGGSPSDGPTLPQSTSPGSEASLQQTLRERILGERAEREPQPDPDPPGSPNKREVANVVAPPPQTAIIAPDFSHLEADHLALPPPPDQSPFRLPISNPSFDPGPPTVAVRPPDVVTDAPPKSMPKPGVATLNLNRRPPDRLAPGKPIQPPVQDVMTRRGVLRIGQPAGKLVPVQTKSSRLTLDERKFVEYTTVFGDTLHSLSIKFFGSSKYYLDIYLANRSVLKNPSEIPVSTKIRIPIIEPLPDQD